MSDQEDRLKKLRDVGGTPQAEEKVHKNFFSYFKKNQASLRFGDKIEALYEWLTSGKLKRQDKLIVLGALLYFINPLDVIPDLTPFLGFSDDLGVIYLVYNYLQNRSLEVQQIQKSKDSDS